MRLTVLVAFTAILSTGCIHYRAKLLDPPQVESDYRSRSLRDPGLEQFVRTNYSRELPGWPPKKLDLELLTLIGFYYNPELAITRVGITLADAVILKAKARINPSLNVEGGYNPNPESEKLFGISPSFTIETAGKRGLRVLQTQKEAEAARISMSETAWRVRSQLRAAMIDYVLSRLKYDQLREEEAIRAEIVQIIDARLSLGEAARPEVEVFRVDLITARAALRAAEGEMAQKLAVVASAAGLPLATLEAIELDAPALEKPPSFESLPVSRVQKAGLLNRADIRRALVDYAAAETALRLEVARQYPDIDLAPSYSFEEGFPRYVIAATLGSLPLFHRNQGSIAVAEVQRSKLEAQFNALQAQVIGEMERAVIQYRAGLAEFNEASQLLTAQKEREESVRNAILAGEKDRLELATTRLQSTTAARTRLDALTHVQAGLGSLEDAVQYPLETGLPMPEPPSAIPMDKGRVP